MKRNLFDKLLDIAEVLVQTRGYHAFSFRDLAKEAGIKSSSIHYYFPTKSDLANELVKRHTENMSKFLEGLNKEKNYKNQLQDYITAITASTYSDGRKMCLGAMLAMNVLTLDSNIQATLIHFFQLNENWLAKILEKGREAGEFNFIGDSKIRAEFIMATLEGTLLLSRLYQEDHRVRELKEIVMSYIQ